VKEVAYTTVQSEESALLNSGLSIGYIDPSVLTSPAPAPGRVGPNWVPLASHYSLVSGSSWSFNYARLTSLSSDPNGATVDQLYIRQALQYAVDQRSIIESAGQGFYGSAIDSPLPPSTPSSLSKQSPIPTRSTSRPLALCSARTLDAGENVQTCTDAGTGTGQCGADIAQGYQLSFNVVWPTGSTSLEATMSAEVANWQTLGILITHSTDTFNNVISDCTGAKPFEICAWG